MVSNTMRGATGRGAAYAIMLCAPWRGRAMLQVAKPVGLNNSSLVPGLVTQVLQRSGTADELTYRVRCVGQPDVSRCSQRNCSIVSAGH